MDKENIGLDLSGISQSKLSKASSRRSKSSRRSQKILKTQDLEMLKNLETDRNYKLFSFDETSNEQTILTQF